MKNALKYTLIIINSFGIYGNNGNCDELILH